MVPQVLIASVLVMFAFGSPGEAATGQFGGRFDRAGGLCQPRPAACRARFLDLARPRDHGFCAGRPNAGPLCCVGASGEEQVSTSPQARILAALAPDAAAANLAGHKPLRTSHGGSRRPGPGIGTGGAGGGPLDHLVPPTKITDAIEDPDRSPNPGGSVPPGDGSGGPDQPVEQPAAVPLPPAGFLLGIAALGLAGLRRRRA